MQKIDRTCSYKSTWLLRFSFSLTFTFIQFKALLLGALKPIEMAGLLSFTASLSLLLLSLARSALAGSLASVTCSNPQLSCQTSAAASCCFNYPGGQFLQTQFWDTNPSTGLFIT